MHPFDADQKLAPSASPNDDVSPAALMRVMHALSHPLLLLRANLIIEDANAAYMDAVGVAAEALIGSHIFDFQSQVAKREGNGEVRNQIRQALLAVQTTGKPQALPLVRSLLTVPAGSRVGKREQWWKMRISPLFDARNQLQYLLLEANDVTDLQHWRRLVVKGAPRTELVDMAAACVFARNGDAGQMRDEDSQFLSQLFHQSPSFIGVLRGPEHTIVTANAGFMKLFGRSDVIGKSLHEALPELRANGYLQLLDEVYRQGRVFVGRDVLAMYQETPASERTRIYIDLLLQPLLDAGGAVTGIFIQGTDVTERKLAEDAFRQANARLEQRVRERTEQLLASQQQLRIFFEHSAEYHGVLRVVDSSAFVFDEVNPAAVRRCNRPREDLIGRTTREVLGEGSEFIDKGIRDCLRLSQPVRFEHAYAGVVFDVLAVPVPRSIAEPVRVIVSARDVTESRKLEEQLRQAQKMEAVGQLTGGIAHDFNNLLTVMIGHLDRLHRRLDDDGLRASAGYALDSARSAAALTHRLLAFSRKQPLDPRPTDINVLIADMTAMLSRTLGETIVVETMLDPKVWLTHVDPHGFENAVLNLALNARDAMPRGGMLSISTSNVWVEAVKDANAHAMTPGEYVRIGVRDSGTGMSPEVLARAFEPFFTTKEVGHGSGLGLSMIYGFIQQSGGHIDIESAAGGGTNVEVYLPRLRDAVDGLAALETSSPAAHVMTKRILAVEDDMAVRHFTVDALRYLGHEVFEAANARDALRILEEAPVDLLFTDVVLPGGVSGRELARQALQLQPHLKVLYTTGYDRGVLGDDTNPSLLLAKPFTMDQLNARIAGLFETQ